MKPEISITSEYQTAETDHNKKSNNDESSFKSIEEEESLTDIYGQSSSNQPVDDPVSDTEDNQTIYIVHAEPSERTLFLVVSDQSIREKDSLTGR